MNDATEFYKKFSLYLTDHISGELKTAFNTMNMDIKTETYGKFQDLIPSFFYAGVFKLNDQTFLVICDAKIVYTLSNRLLGGKGLAETRPDALFTESELFFGKLLMDWVLDFYKKHNDNVTLSKFETEKSQFQSFFPTDQLEIASMTCTNEQKDVGHIYVCHKATTEK